MRRPTCYIEAGHVHACGASMHGGHAGACLVFDVREILGRLEDSVKPYRGHGWNGNRRIKYVDRRRILPTDFSRFDTPEEFRSYFDEALFERTPGYGLDFFNSLYYQKSRDWLSEHEWRFSSALWQLPEDQLNEPISASYGTALKAVILGDNFASPQGICDAIDANASSSKPALFQCSWKAGAPVLNCI
jgi:hypothetical protein